MDSSTKPHGPARPPADAAADETPPAAFATTAVFALHDSRPALPAQPQLVRGTIIDRYELVAPLGSGGFGEVWRARDPSLGRDVAIKILRPKQGDSELLARRLHDEAQKLSVAHGSGIVAIHDVGFANGRHYIISELLEGGDLAAQLTQRRYTQREAAALVADVALTLHHAHLKGLVHRDIKPSNILFDAAGRPHVADFGLAASERDLLEEAPATLGTAAYMAPEQARGESHLADARTDVYSLGMVLYQLLCGRLPFVGRTTREYTEQILQREPRPPRTINDSISIELERICLKCLARDMANRYSTADELARELRGWLRRAETATQPSPGNKARRWGWAVVALAVGLGGWYAVTTDFTRRNSGQTAPSANRVEQAWIKAFGSRPTELIWPGHRGTGSASFDEALGAFEVISNEARLFQLVEAAEQDFVLGLSFEQSPWIGGAGIFLGYHLGPLEDDRYAAKFQLIYMQELQSVDGDRIFQLRRILAHIDPASGSMTAIPLHELAVTEMAFPAMGVPIQLELHVRKGRLQKVLLDGRECTDMVLDAVERHVAAEDYRGPLGLFQRRGVTWFRNPILVKKEE